MLAQFVLFDGFDPLDVIAPYEVLDTAGMLTGGAVRTELVSAEGAREVAGGIGTVSLRAVTALDPARADLIVVPGAYGELPGDDEDLTDEERDRTIPAILGRTLGTDLPRLLDEALCRDGVTVATVCGGSLILAMAGLIEGRPATTHHMGLDLLGATGARPIDARIVDDGDLVSGAGVTSGLDLGLYLVERELGPRIAHGVEKLIAHERRGVVWHERGPTPPT
ncbi:DJ-1/PfpI family protein [Streptosporangium sp. NBC_01469]|uniref:DJ-1/PfpI family protein n=1 Tax=Streptosporangium sp. NBC_01469 TaxID=2903898 RepID=UPI002E292A18|nr:DJ-1/PfpI family protein [Streptosporangium sp. NBC_01469]